MASSGAKLRAVSAEIVDAVTHQGQSLDAAVASHETRIAVKDRSLLRMICYGSLRHHWQLMAWVDQLIEKPLRKRDRVINALLAIGLYQIVLMRIPDHAVVSETVEAARQLKRPKLAGLVNACLRRFVREEMAKRPATSPSAIWNHPDWIINTLKNDWPEDWQSILEANNARAPMWLRANASRNSAEEYRERLGKEDIIATLQSEIPDAVKLAEPLAVENLPGFAEGDVSVQDGAAQIAGRWLARIVSGRVLDACAAPGGKSGHLLELGDGRINLLALDVDAARSESVADNLARLGFSATIVAADASKPEEWWDKQPFEGILLDAPCSASGVIRRHPDIKLLRRPSDLARLAKLQMSLLEALWPLLKEGGTLLYATCSVFAAENEETMKAFTANHSDAFEQDLLPNNNIRDLMRRMAVGYQILPGTADLDGFYYAALQNKVS